MQAINDVSLLVGTNYISQTPNNINNNDDNNDNYNNNNNNNNNNNSKNEVKHHSIIVFLSTIIMNFLQLKYQGGGVVSSPFETNPIIVLLSVFFFFLYCFFYYNPRFVSRFYVYNGGLNRGMAMTCAPLALACMGTLLFPAWLRKTVVAIAAGAAALHCAMLFWVRFSRGSGRSSPTTTTNLLPVTYRETLIFRTNSQSGTTPLSY